jgi:DNA-binding response OmpR family regulator
MNANDNKKLLLIDDSSDLLEVLKIYFDKKGYIVDIVSNNREIYSAINNSDPDILLMDVLLGGSDGRQICKTLRDCPVTKHLGIILTSASSDNLENYRMFGADDCIEKPFELTDLEQKIASILTWAPIRKKALLKTH